MSTAVADAVASGALGERLWMYANYHCNLECSYCLTESSPTAERRLVDPAWMRDRAHEARALGFRSLGVTGGEPFMVASMPDTLAELSETLPLVVLSNATLFSGPRLERVAAALAGRPVHVQVSLDAPDAVENDTRRGEGNWTTVVDAVPQLVKREVKVRIATTTDGIADGDLERLCALHRSWGIPDEDHVVRPIVARGRAVTTGAGVAASVEDLPAELCLTADGAFWSPFGPTVLGGRLDTDLLITRTTAPVAIPAEAMVRLVEGRPAGRDVSLNIR